MTVTEFVTLLYQGRPVPGFLADFEACADLPVQDVHVWGRNFTVRTAHGATVWWGLATFPHAVQLALAYGVPVTGE